jgi:Flp pilus assembly protein TadG
MPVTAMTSRRRRCGGQAILVLALAGSVVFGFGAMALDQGISMADRRDLQGTADAAALAAARSSSQGLDAEHLVAMQYLAGNIGFAMSSVTGCTGSGSGQCPAGTYTVGDYTVTMSDTASTLDLDIQHRRTTLVAGVLGISTAVTGSAARAASSLPAVGAACGICILDPSASSALSMVTSGGIVSVTGGNLVIDSTSASAASITGTGRVQASGTILIAGGYSVVGSGGFSPTPTTGSSAVTDPLAQVPPPVVAGTSQSYSLVGSSPATIGPGLYSSIGVVGGGTLTLSPGIYVITSSLSLTGPGTIAGTGVLLYFACSSYPTPCTSGQSGGTASLTGSGSYQLAAPTASTCASIPATCPYTGLLLFYDRNNAAQMSITGSGSNSSTGTIYAKSSTLSVVGSGGTVNSLIVVDKVAITGSGTVGLSFQSSQNYQNPASSRLLR